MYSITLQLLVHVLHYGLWSFGMKFHFDLSMFYSIENKGSGHHGDLAVMGVVMSGEHIERSLSTLHSSHADAIGAPKVRYAHLHHTHFIIAAPVYVNC